MNDDDDDDDNDSDLKLEASVRCTAKLSTSFKSGHYISNKDNKCIGGALYRDPSGATLMNWKI